VDVVVELTIVVEVELTIVGIELGGVTVDGALERAAAKTASATTMKRLVFIAPPRWST
jgi:hypothetical protein